MGFSENNEKFENENTENEAVHEPYYEKKDGSPDETKKDMVTVTKKKSIRWNRIFKTAVLLAVIAVIVLSFFAFREIKGFGGNDNYVYIEIRHGAPLKEISSNLKDNGIIGSEELFYFYAKDKSADFKAGLHRFKTSMSYDEICDSLCEIPSAETIKVVIPEGYEIRLIAEKFSETGLCTADEFLESAENDTFDYDFLTDKSGVRYKLEGFLFPATYEFEYGTSAYDIIDKMLKTFDNIYSDKYSARAKELGMTDFEVVTLASIVEREAASMSEHKKVAGVFYNRLQIGMNLESCATVQYILKERKPVLSIADTKIDSPYNTYKYSGLPVGPVACPGKSAIEAVLYPEEHDYFFFVAKADGSGHVFSRTLEEHNRAAAQNQ